MRRPLPLIAFLCLAALPAAASVQDDLAALQAQYRDEVIRARRLRADAEEARAEIATLDSRLAELRKAQGAEDAQIGIQRARLRELSRQEAAVTTDLARVRDGQERIYSALQMMSRRPPPPLLIPADRAVDTVRAAILMKAVAPELERRAASYDARLAEIARIRRLAVLASERLMTTESEAGDRRAMIEAASARRTVLLGVIKADADRSSRAAATLEERIRALGGRPELSAPEAEETAARLPGGRSRLSPPVPGAPAVRFGAGSSGWRWSEVRGPVGAPANARVDYAGPLSGWGQVVILDLGPGWRAVVAGLDAVSVQAGARVSDGQALGSANGEVYFELRREERPVDPRPFLGG